MTPDPFLCNAPKCGWNNGALASRFDSFYFRVRMNFDSHPIATTRVAPHHGVVPNNAARRMIQAGEDWLMGMLASVEAGHELADFLTPDNPAIHAKQLICLGTFAQRRDAAIRVSERQVPLLREHDVVIEFQRQP